MTKGINVSASIIAGYFVKNIEARGAIRELKRKGFCRVALMHRTAGGDVRISECFPWRRALRATLAAILLGGAAGVASQFFYIQGWSFSILTLAGGLTGAVAGLVWIRRSKYGIEAVLMQNHSRWLMPGETVLLLQTPIENLQAPLAVLRESSDIPPAVFVMHPNREKRRQVQGSEGTLSPAQIRAHALRIAGDHQVDPKPNRNTRLLKRLKQSRLWVRQVCSDLSAATRLEQSATPAAEWILDNEYILEGSARDVLLNLPRHFYRQLPKLVGCSLPGSAAHLRSGARNSSHKPELRLDRENILAFIEAYQSVRTLSIGELWAIPQMLRIALIESIQNLAATALADLRERQLADFWANRLIAANRRDPNQLFSILAELAEAEPSPSPYFGAQLIGHLYDEAAALAPVQSWLERTLRESLNDLNLREQNRQDQGADSHAAMPLPACVSSSCWIGGMSSRQLSRVEQVLRWIRPASIRKWILTPATAAAGRLKSCARRSGQSEEQVAQRVIGMATQSMHDSAEDERRQSRRDLADRGGKA